MPKSMKTAFIRVTKVNDTEQGKQIFTEEQIKDTLDEWAFSAGIEYWFIDHVPDDDDPNDHFHIVIKFRNPTMFEIVKNKFPYGRIETAKNIRRAVQYLVHMNHPEKLSYPWENVITNVPDLTPFKVQSRSQQDVSLQRIFEKIESGEITPFNYQDVIPIDISSKHRTVINNAFQHCLDRAVKNVDRDITVFYYYGRSGIGKTSFAKMYCKSLGYDVCISSSGNDPLQDYKGQRALIWDDFRDTQFEYSDLIKFLDPNTRSSGKSRYRNKDFVGDLIIITSTQRMDFLYKRSITHKQGDNPDDLIELRRRIPEYYEFVDDKVRIYMFDGRKYMFFREFTSPIPSLVEENPSHVFDSSPFEKMGISLRDATLDIKNSENERPLRDLENEKMKFEERQKEWGQKRL